MSKIAVLGMGAMGERIAIRLLAAGHEVRVWNRTPNAAQALADAGASSRPTPRDAATGADAVLSMVRDDAASEDVWFDSECGAVSGMSSGTIAIESSTLSLAYVKAWAERVAAEAVVPVEAPVSGSRPQAEAGKLVYFLGGLGADVEQAKALLSPLGSAFHHVGPIGAGTAVKLVTNTLLGVQVGAWAELLPFMQAQGLNMDAALAAISGTSSWAPVAASLTAAMLSGNHKPLFPIDLMAKDLDYMRQAGQDADLPMNDVLHKGFKTAVDAGLGTENMSALVKLYQK